MPEGNEIHRWAALHTAAFAGKKVRLDAPNGRFLDAGLLDRKVLRQVLAVGKHLGFDFGRDRILHVHLGMYGDFTVGAGALPPERGALRLRLWDPLAIRANHSPSLVAPRVGYRDDDGSRGTDGASIAWSELRGPTDCSVFSQAKWTALLARLGPDPLNGDPAARFVQAAISRKTPIGTLLMDQTVAAGVGNIFRAEVLFRWKLSPFRSGKEVPEVTLKAMWKDLRPLMQAAMVDRRIVTTRPRDRPTKKRGIALKEEAHYVYRRQGKPCWICGTLIRTEVLAGRNLFWCTVCQAD